MSVIVDTNVWSISLRRPAAATTREQEAIRAELHRLSLRGEVLLPGPVRQELLSGIADPIRFELLREYLREFEHAPIHVEDHEYAAEMFNVCRRRGIQGSQVDFLICALADRRAASIFTLDRDFEQYSSIFGIELHRWPRG